jgi:hypothetical protein
MRRNNNNIIGENQEIRAKIKGLELITVSLEVHFSCEFEFPTPHI